MSHFVEIYDLIIEDFYHKQIIIDQQLYELKMLNITEQPLATIPASATRPGPEVLEQVMEELR